MMYVNLYGFTMVFWIVLLPAHRGQIGVNRCRSTTLSCGFPTVHFSKSKLMTRRQDLQATFYRLSFVFTAKSSGRDTKVIPPSTSSPFAPEIEKITILSRFFRAFADHYPTKAFLTPSMGTPSSPPKLHFPPFVLIFVQC